MSDLDHRIAAVNMAAQPEGWAIFESHGDRVELQIQRLDDSETLSGDGAAWRHVVRRASEGGVHHAEALAIIRDHSPEEYRRIVEHTA
jgi:hypothetical protein